MMPILQNAGYDVMGLDTYYFEECTLGDDRAVFPSLRRDLRDITVKDLEGFDAVIHLAALSNDPLGDLDSNWTYDINHVASVNLAKVAKQAGVSRFLYSSSCSMYGAAGDQILDENAPLTPLTAYAISKVKTETDVSQLADRSFSPVFMRNATAYGVSPRLRADIVLNNLVCWACTTGKIRIMSDGTPWRPIVHVEDIVAAFAAALVAPRESIHNQAFNVGVDGENYQVRELADIVKAVVPNCEVEYAGQGGPDPRNYRVNFARITNELPGFEPKWNARKGAEQLYEAFQHFGMTTDEFNSRKYTRLKQLRYLLDNDRLDNTLRWKIPQEAVLNK
jgi:nucleoside-diphosphate-sugar epimerase